MKPQSCSHTDRFSEKIVSAAHSARNLQQNSY